MMYIGYQSNIKNSKLIINNKVINIEIADTNAKRQQGLSDRQKLNDYEGMLFVFDLPGYPSFWMKDMLFDLDFIWINDYKIIDITENVPSHQKSQINLPTYRPKSPADMMLEVNAGFVKKNGIKIGEKIKILSNTIK